MAYLQFNKAELVNLEYSLKRELLATNRAGGYCNTTIVCCNTRKYHGLFAVPIEKFGGHRYMLLSALDETLFQHGMPFNLGIHCYGDVYEPRGHKYIVDFEMDPYPVITYRVGGMLFKKEILFAAGSEQLMIRYTLLDAHSHTMLRLKPYLAFRSIHALTVANADADTHYKDIEGGVSFCMYRDFPELNLQISKPCEYIHVPDWYKNVVYKEEYRRGFDCQEDLLVPGFFEMPLEKGESIIFSASTTPVPAQNLKAQFTRETKRRMPRDNYENCLKAAAEQNFAAKGKLSCICTGFSWHEIGGMRETCIALPGLTLCNKGDAKLFEKILSDLITENTDSFLKGSNQVESPLRLTEAVQQLARFTGDEEGAWKKYGKFLKKVVESYMAGRPEVKLHDNGLLWAEKPGVALSWMNAYIDGRAVTERAGYQVETNALWYNAIKFGLELARVSHDKEFLIEWEPIATTFPAVFKETFWSKEMGYLADYVNGDYKNFQVRPNMLIAASLPHAPISEKIRQLVLKRIDEELRIEKGIRTLSPKDPEYKGHYKGTQAERDAAYHQGTAWPWLLFPFTDCMLKVHPESAPDVLTDILYRFDSCMSSYGISTIAEITDGDPPYKPNGCISQAWSVAALLYMKWKIEQVKK